MHSRSSTKSSLLLIELILVVLFFAVTSAVCMSLFVRSHIVAQNSQDLNRAAILLQNTAEEIKRKPPSGEAALPQKTYYSADWVPLTEESPAAAYLREVTLKREEPLPLLTANLSVKRLRDEKVLFTLTVSEALLEGGGTDEQ